jgi:hypothetical protein
VARHGYIPALSHEEAVTLDTINDAIGRPNSRQALAALNGVVTQANPRCEFSREVFAIGHLRVANDVEVFARPENEHSHAANMVAGIPFYQHASAARRADQRSGKLDAGLDQGAGGLRVAAV